MAQSSQRDHGPFSPPTAPDARRPPLPSQLPNPTSKTAWESDMLDQAAVSRMLLEGMYRRAGYQARSLERIVKQSEEQGHVQRRIFSALVFVMFFQMATLLIFLLAAYRIFTPIAIP